MKSDFDTDEQRWQAVLERDPRADGVFLFAVRTTGVYCRPSCSSRHPLRGNARFFESAAAAREAGFRACLRCRPDASPEAAASALLVAACEAIEAAETPPAVADLARDAGVSESHLQRVFRRLLGVTPRGYAAAVRARRLHGALAAGRSVTDALYEAGFGSSSRLYENAGENLLGMAPSRIRQGAPGETIEYATAPCSLGRVLVAATARGICAIELGDDDGALREALAARFPRAALRAAGEAFAGTVARVLALVEDPSRQFGLPLDVRGTAFQRRVWESLRELRAGETATYAGLARRLGKPDAQRAVAGAVAANPLAVVQPCHRVLRSDGGLGGYRWGLDRKRALLARESAPEGGDA